MPGRPPILLDEMVAASIGEFLRSRGYTVQQVRDVFALGTDDAVIAAGVNNVGGIIVTWDKDFRNISKRLLSDGSPRFPNMGMIHFSCDASKGLSRLQDYIDLIEYEYGLALHRSDRRLLVSIGNEIFHVLR